MNLHPTTKARALDALADASYGSTATFELEDGRVLALTIEPDTDTNIRDYDTFGTFSKYAYDYGDRGSGRPDDMNGNAEKIQVDRGLFVWWQPPADVPELKRGTEQFAAFRESVRDILTNGYCGYLLELRAPEPDAAGRPIALAVASLWGVDQWDASSEYGREVVSDLILELETEEGEN